MAARCSQEYEGEDSAGRYGDREMKTAEKKHRQSKRFLRKIVREKKRRKKEDGMCETTRLVCGGETKDRAGRGGSGGESTQIISLQANRR